MKITIVYDDFCPVCSRVVIASRLKDEGHTLQLVSARNGNLVDVQGLDLSGHDLDQSFVVVIDGHAYTGPDAAYMLSLVSRGNTPAYLLFKVFSYNPRLSRLFYPLMVRGRALLLRLLGIPRINND